MDNPTLDFEFRRKTGNEDKLAISILLTVASKQKESHKVQNVSLWNIAIAVTLL